MLRFYKWHLATTTNTALLKFDLQVPCKSMSMLYFSEIMKRQFDTVISFAEQAQILICRSFCD